MCKKKQEANKPWPNITANLIKQGGWGRTGTHRPGDCVWLGRRCILAGVDGGGVWKIWPQLRSHEGPAGWAAGSQARHMVSVFCLSTLCLSFYSPRSKDWLFMMKSTGCYGVALEGNRVPTSCTHTVLFVDTYCIVLDLYNLDLFFYFRH